MLAHVNLIVLLVWLYVELVPIFAEYLADGDWN